MELVNNELKKVKDFWDEASCGEDLYLKGFEKEDYLTQSSKRYELEPEILLFGDFKKYAQLKVLEIGVGLGSDHQLFAEVGAELYGIDLTERAINHTTRRFNLLGLKSNLKQGNAEKLDFESNLFDLVYSWGVIHHSPNTDGAVKEIHRVLKIGGEAKIMIYNKYSIIGFMLWIRYGLLRLKPFIKFDEIYSKYLESPGTKAYDYTEAKVLFKDFELLTITSPLTHGDLLNSDVGQRHRGVLLTLAKKIWPRKLLKLFFKNYGLYLMIHLRKLK